MTAVEWLVDMLKQQGLLIGEPDNLITVKEAKEMEKQQIIISDEDIEKGANECYPYDEFLDDGLKGMIISAKKGAWFDAIKWYREQIKSRQ